MGLTFCKYLFRQLNPKLACCLVIKQTESWKFDSLEANAFLYSMYYILSGEVLNVLTASWKRYFFREILNKYMHNMTDVIKSTFKSCETNLYLSKKNNEYILIKQN